MDTTSPFNPTPCDTSKESTLTYCLMAFVAMAGLAYINFLPGVITALAGGIGFSDTQAGHIVAFNGYGGILGSTIAILLIQRIKWKLILALSFCLLAGIDLCTPLLSSYIDMVAGRFMAGVFGGICVGIGLAVLARFYNADRAFGLLLLAQFCLGSLVIYLLPHLESMLGPYAVFYLMAGLSGVSLMLLPLLPSLPAKAVAKHASSPFAMSGVFILLSIFCYQTAASGIWAYVGLIGLDAGLTANTTSEYIAATGLLGLCGAMLPVILGTQTKRQHWIIAGIVISVTTPLLLIYSHLTTLYVLAMALLFLVWPAVQAWLMATTAELDGSGRLSATAGLAAYVGLATGPLLASLLLKEGSYTLMLLALAAVFIASLLCLLKPVLEQGSRYDAERLPLSE